MNEKGKLFVICMLLMAFWGGLTDSMWFTERFLYALGIILLIIHFAPILYDNCSDWLKKQKTKKNNNVE